jgi:hypothetical protein
MTRQSYFEPPCTRFRSDLLRNPCMKPLNQPVLAVFRIVAAIYRKFRRPLFDPISFSREISPRTFVPSTLRLWVGDLATVPQLSPVRTVKRLSDRKVVVIGVLFLLARPFGTRRDAFAERGPETRVISVESDRQGRKSRA